MKKFVRSLCALGIALTMLFSLAACSNVGSITKAFEKEGFTHAEDMDSSVKEAMEKFFTDQGFTVTTHLFTKGEIIPTCAVMVFEFKSSKDLDKTIEDCETVKAALEIVKGFVKDLQKSDYVNGNCLLVPTLCSNPSYSKVVEIFKNA